MIFTDIEIHLNEEDHPIVFTNNKSQEEQRRLVSGLDLHVKGHENDMSGSSIIDEMIRNNSNSSGLYLDRYVNL